MKLLAAIVAATVVGTMSISAFGLSYETSTNYDGEKVTVTTNVTLTEAEKNDEVAYLVYAGDEANSTTIKYIDQENANGRTSVPFTWTTTDSGIVAEAYVGTTSTASGDANNEEKSNVVKVAGYDVTYTVSGNGIVMLEEEVEDGEELGDVVASADLTDVASAVFYVFPEAGYVFENVTGTGASATSYADGKAVEVVFTDDAEITFNFVPASGEAELAAYAEISETVDTTNGVVCKFATITGAVKEVGILVAPDATAAEQLSSVTSIADAKAKNIYALKAYQVGSTGIYAVSVTDAENIEAGAAVAAYAIDADGNLLIAD